MTDKHNRNSFPLQGSGLEIPECEWELGEDLLSMSEICVRIERDPNIRRKYDGESFLDVFPPVIWTLMWFQQEH